MKILVLQHAKSETSGELLGWAQENEHTIERLMVPEAKEFPSASTYDCVVSLGGPMGVYEADRHPWISKEIDFLKKNLGLEKPIIGICLGSQMLAAALGSKVYRGPQREIGWFEVEWADAALEHPILEGTPSRFHAFHWHQDTFDLPKGARRLASSRLYDEQAYLYGEKAIGFQFHPEVTEDLLLSWVTESCDELRGEPSVQKPNEILDQIVRVKKQSLFFREFLTRFFLPGWRSKA